MRFYIRHAHASHHRAFDPAGVFTGLLRAHGIVTLADVRSVRRSRHNPQFDRDAVAACLEAVGIGYAHLPSLGGMRRPRPDSVNLGRRSAGATAILCAEAEPSRCHRGLLSDARLVRGWRVLHILDSGAMEHAPSPTMRTVDDRPGYP